jgi:hypothetical protein
VTKTIAIHSMKVPSTTRIAIITKMMPNGGHEGAVVIVAGDRAEPGPTPLAGLLGDLARRTRIPCTGDLLISVETVASGRPYRNAASAVTES